MKKMKEIKIIFFCYLQKREKKHHGFRLGFMTRKKHTCVILLLLFLLKEPNQQRPQKDKKRFFFIFQLGMINILSKSLILFS